jgi:hypothetical protein
MLDHNGLHQEWFIDIRYPAEVGVGLIDLAEMIVQAYQCFPENLRPSTIAVDISDPPGLFLSMQLHERGVPVKNVLISQANKNTYDSSLLYEHLGNGR